ncbi:MAG: histidine--tRNA ligase [Lachnospiraceae bacterium]|nr:histidine--tRNA ligase [Lachnospiraceae bacterium]
MKTSPIKGTRDYLPTEAELRDSLQNIIANTYKKAGYERITTPILEAAENLDKSDGGENLNLIFKVLKRGKKLENALENSPTENSLSDMGLRYDLTLPLSRYYAANKENLVTPFKVIQMDRVYRAERPQKGRLREFMQCDIDIIGNPDSDAETDLILTTAKALKAIGLDKFTIKLNDRRILKAIFTYSGFDDSYFDKISIAFDKLDKIGMDGVKEELEEIGLPSDPISKFLSIFKSESLSLEDVRHIEGCTEYADRLLGIINTVNAITDNAYELKFTPSLVRGQGYYTGTIFEVAVDGYSGAVAGGGRYDNLIGKFLKQDIPAVGFSIGFERIFGILSEDENLKMADKPKKIALFFDDDNMKDAFKYADTLRETMNVSLIKRPKKLGKYLNKIENAGFDGFKVYGEEGDIKLFD